MTDPSPQPAPSIDLGLGMNPGHDIRKVVRQEPVRNRGSYRSVIFRQHGANMDI